MNHGYLLYSVYIQPSNLSHWKFAVHIRGIHRVTMIYILHIPFDFHCLSINCVARVVISNLSSTVFVRTEQIVSMLIYLVLIDMTCSCSGKCVKLSLSFPSPSPPLPLPPFPPLPLPSLTQCRVVWRSGCSGSVTRM